MKRFRWTCLCMLGGLALTATATLAHADAWNKKTYVTIGQSIEVPGAVLAPGKYVFKLVDSASNRHIVQIMNEQENHVYTTNLAIPKQRMEPADKTILTFYEMRGGGPEPLRAWFYPGDTIGQEFAYPRERAREIALAVKQDVPVLAESRQPEVAAPTTQAAVEPAVEPTTEPTTEPATVADNSADRIATPTPTEEAAPAAPEAPPEAAADEPEQQPAPAAETQPAPTEPAMPRTAGNTATLGLAGLCCLGIAALLRVKLGHSASRS